MYVRDRNDTGSSLMMKYLRMIWRFMTLDTRPMDARWRPTEPVKEDTKP